MTHCHTCLIARLTTNVLLVALTLHMGTLT